MDDVLGVILGGGRGARLSPLTLHRSKPAVPIGGKYRLIDIPISNCLNAKLRRIFVLTQYNSESLNKHITQTYKFDGFNSLKRSVGVAVQWLAPLGLFRFSYGIALNAKNDNPQQWGDQTEGFQFSVGNAF
jgi:glucose-1-phosphate adenylyltransferase